MIPSIRYVYSPAGRIQETSSPVRTNPDPTAGQTADTRPNHRASIAPPTFEPLSDTVLTLAVTLSCRGRPNHNPRPLIPHPPQAHGLHSVGMDTPSSLRVGDGFHTADGPPLITD